MAYSYPDDEKNKLWQREFKEMFNYKSVALVIRPTKVYIKTFGTLEEVKSWDLPKRKGIEFFLEV